MSNNFNLGDEAEDLGMIDRLLEALANEQIVPVKMEGYAQTFRGEIKVTMSNGDVIDIKYTCPQNMADTTPDETKLKVNGVDMSTYMSVPWEVRDWETSLKLAYRDFLKLMNPL
jgi:hypothetical protein